MPLPSHRATRYRKSLSSLFIWSRRNSTQSTGPSISGDDDTKPTAERSREIQLTLDKLEGRLVVTSNGQLKRASDASDGSLDEICGLMSILAEGLSVPGHSERGMYGASALAHTCENHEHERNRCSQDRFGDAAQYGGPPDCSANGTGYVSSTLGVCDLGLDGTADADPGDCRLSGLLRGHLQKERNITHPAFSGFEENKNWDTSSRVSDDSLFAEHDRRKPEVWSPPTAPSSLSYRGASAFLPSTAGVWLYLHDQIPSLPLRTEPGATCGSLMYANQDFFDPLAIDTTGISLLASGVGTQQTVKPSPTPPQLPSKKSNPIKVAGIQPKPSLIKRMLGVFVKPLEMIGSLSHGASGVSSADKFSTSGEGLHIYDTVPQGSGKTGTAGGNDMVKHKLRHRFFRKKVSVADGHWSY